MPLLWPYSPLSVSETLSFSTDIGESRTSEFRWSLHDGLTTMDYSHQFTAWELLEVRFALRSNALQQWLVPLWSECAVAGAVAADATSIAVSTDADYRDGGQAFIAGAEGFAVVDIDTVGSGVLNLAASPAVGIDFAGPVLVMPLALCIMPGAASLQRAAALEVISVGFRRLDQIDLAVNPYPLLSGYPVITDPSYIANGLSGSLEQRSLAITNGFGWLELFPDSLVFRERSELRFADHVPAERWARKRWLHYQRGADLPFWLPTWRRDFRLKENIGGGGTSMRIEPPAGLALDALVGFAVQFRLADGTVHHSTLGTAVMAGGDWIIQISTAPVAVPFATSVLSLMVLHRFASDQFTLDSEQFVGYGQLLTTVSAPTIEVLP
jgi:hypothetical protein